MQTPVRRGITVINSLLFDEVAVVPEKTERSGRDPVMIERRDDLLLHRLYFKSKIQRKTYDDVMAELEVEFFLRRFMLQKIITRKSDIALMIKKQQLTIADLKTKFPWINWS